MNTPPAQISGDNDGQKLWHRLFTGALEFKEPFRSEQLDAHAKRLSVSQRIEAFNWACSAGHVPAIAALLGNGIEIGQKFNSGNTGLHIAAACGKNDAVLFLLERGADIEARNSDGRTALHMAAVNARNETAYLLCEKGANSRITDYKGRTAFALSARQKNPLNLGLMHRFAEAGKKQRQAIAELNQTIAEFKKPKVKFRLKTGDARP